MESRRSFFSSIIGGALALSFLSFLKPKQRWKELSRPETVNCYPRTDVLKRSNLMSDHDILTTYFGYSDKQAYKQKVVWQNPQILEDAICHQDGYIRKSKKETT